MTLRNIIVCCTSMTSLSRVQPVWPEVIHFAHHHAFNAHPFCEHGKVLILGSL